MKKLIQLILLFLSLVIALLICEGLTRSLNLAPKLNWINPKAPNSSFQLSSDPLLGYEFKKNEKRKEFNLYESFPYTNEHGFRDYPRNIKKNKFRILLLGDSVVAGTGIRDLKKLISSQLQLLLNCNKVEVMNIGVSGYNIIGENQLFKTIGIKFQPDILIHIITDNDFNANNSMIHQVSLNSYSQSLITLIKTSDLLKFILFTNNPIRNTFFKDFAKTNKHLGSMQTKSIENALWELKKITKEQGTKLITILWPSFLNKEVLPFSSIPEKNQLISNTLEKLKLPYHYIHSVYPKSDNPFKAYTVGDYMHVNELGAQYAAKGIKEILKQKELDPLIFDNEDNDKCLSEQVSF